MEATLRALASHRTPMAGLSLSREGAALDPSISPCSVHLSPSAADFADDLKPDLQTLVDQVSKHSPPPGSLASELSDRWFQRLTSDQSLSSDLKGSIEALVGKLLRERMAGAGEGSSARAAEMGEGSSSSSPTESSGSKKRRRELEEVLMWLKGAAAGSSNWTGVAAEECEKRVLKTRRALHLRMEDVDDVEGFPYKSRGKKQKTGNLSTEKSLRKQNGVMSLPERGGRSRRRSKRLAQKLDIHYCSGKGRIGKGPTFQADVPDWTGPPTERDFSDYKESLNDSKWLGNLVWPIKVNDGETSELMVGKGRPASCACFSKGSVACIRSHISEASLQLNSNLGPVFFSWGFDEMGEEVSKSWNSEEQMRFSALERLEPEAEYKTFWKVASNHFTAKTRRDLVSYYFNVFLPRRLGNQSRLTPPTVDSEEDDDDEEPFVDGKGKALRVLSSRSSQRARGELTDHPWLIRAQMFPAKAAYLTSDCISTITSLGI